MCPTITFDIGYCGEAKAIITFIDQNNIEHRREFLIQVYGEKPTCMQISVLGDTPHLIYATSSILSEMYENRK